MKFRNLFLSGTLVRKARLVDYENHVVTPVLQFGMPFSNPCNYPKDDVFHCVCTDVLCRFISAKTSFFCIFRLKDEHVSHYVEVWMFCPQTFCPLDVSPTCWSFCPLNKSQIQMLRAITVTMVEGETTSKWAFRRQNVRWEKCLVFTVQLKRCKYFVSQFSEYDKCL